jgi:hypothetical protein
MYVQSIFLEILTIYIINIYEVVNFLNDLCSRINIYERMLIIVLTILIGIGISNWLYKIV